MSSLGSDDSAKQDDLLEDLLQRVGMMQLTNDIEQEHIVDPKLHEIRTMEDVAEYIKSGACKSIAILCGAGLSTPCGIPDFRSPQTGIFSNLNEYNLPYPEAMFDSEYFQENPKPFYEFSRKILKNLLEASPSKAHYFIKLLADKNLLTRVYSQNIDSLEEKAGVDEKLVCCVHGSLKKAYCIECRSPVDRTQVITTILKNEIPKCPKCDGFVKPAIVFYGEPLPPDFSTCIMQDYQEIDLLIIMGTSLTVYPVSYVADLVRAGTPRLLLNNAPIGKFSVKPQNQTEEISPSHTDDSSSSYFDPHAINHKRVFQDVFYKDTCDNGCLKLAQLLGWEQPFKQLYQHTLESTPAALNPKP